MGIGNWLEHHAASKITMFLKITEERQEREICLRERSISRSKLTKFFASALVCARSFHEISRALAFTLAARAQRALVERSQRERF